MDAFVNALAWSLGILGMGLILTVVLQVYVGLRPLHRLRTALQAVRDGRAERLGADYPSEVQPLADELNGLLDHTRDVLGRARAHVGNLAHALKTPLAVLANAAAAPGEELTGVVAQQTAQMRRHVDHHLTRARTVGRGGLSSSVVEVGPVLDAIAGTVRKLYRDRALTIACDCEPGLRFRGERNDLEEMLGNLCDNAGKWANGRIAIRALTVSGTARGGLNLLIVLDDDGPGIAADQREALFARGRRADESSPGSGLGLAIVRDIAALYGGAVSLSESPWNGLRVELELPGGGPLLAPRSGSR